MIWFPATHTRYSSWQAIMALHSHWFRSEVLPYKLNPFTLQPLLFCYICLDLMTWSAWTCSTLPPCGVRHWLKFLVIVFLSWLERSWPEIGIAIQLIDWCQNKVHLGIYILSRDLVIHVIFSFFVILFFPDADLYSVFFSLKSENATVLLNQLGFSSLWLMFTQRHFWRKSASRWKVAW